MLLSQGSCQFKDFQEYLLPPNFAAQYVQRLLGLKLVIAAIAMEYGLRGT